MEAVTHADIEAAAERISGHAVETPLLHSDVLDELCGARVFLKAENLQRTGSFKFRGAFNAISKLCDADRAKGVLAVSSGNHAQGIAEAARLLGCDATILMPEDTPAMKIARTKRSGGTVLTFDRYKDDRDTVVAEYQATTGKVFIHPFDNADVIAGQGTCGLEIIHQLAKLGETIDYALVCTGGGGLTNGVLLALQHHMPNVRVHTVEPEGYDDYKRSLESGTIERADTSQTSICDALLPAAPGKLGFLIGKDRLAEGLVVSDEEALAAVAFAFRELKLVVEPGGAVSLAALMSGKLLLDGETVVATLSGGNIDAAMFVKALEQ